MRSESAFKLGSILLLVGFCMAGANVKGSGGFIIETIRSESTRVDLSQNGLEQAATAELSDDADIRSEVEAVQEINKMNITEFAPYKIR